LEHVDQSLQRFNTPAFGTVAPLATLPRAIGNTLRWASLAAVANDAIALPARLNVLLMHLTVFPLCRSTANAARNARARAHGVASRAGIAAARSRRPRWHAFGL